MQQVPALVQQDLVLVGGGHSHVTVLKRFGMRPEPGVRVTLICRDTQAPYSGMLPGMIAGHYGFDDAHIDLGPLSRFASARFLRDEVIGIDRANRRLLCRGRPPVAYDVVAIDIGSSPIMRDVEGAEGVVVPVKPIDRFARKWTRIKERILAQTGPSVIAVVGGGAGGVEILLALQHRLHCELLRIGRTDEHLEYRLYTRDGEILPSHNRRVQRKFRRVLAERGVIVRPDSGVVRVEKNGRTRLIFDRGDFAEVDEALWVTTAEAQRWPGEGGLEVDEHGFIRVNDTLQSTNDLDVFASGDVAAVVGYPRPKAGVFAVRQGPPLEHNLRRRLRGESLRPFHPQRHFLSLVSTGDRYAVASRSFWSLEGRWVWRWKDWIDRRFMRKYNDLPEMEPQAEPASRDDTKTLRTLSSPTMRCAGCGSKVGSGVLERALARLSRTPHPDVIIGLDAPDDAAVVRVPEGKVLVQTVDHFTAFIDDPFVFGRIAAVHALSDLHAMGAEPQSALALATVPYADEAKLEEDLVQLLAGALGALDECGAALVGGHTSEGPTMALGFAVSGFAHPEALSTKSGARPGEALVLTKPIGSGVLFAAHMRQRAKGRWIEAALASMSTSNQAAAEILRRHGVSAMTDVTGFGVLGHLLEMLRASEVGAEIDIAAVPAYDGAIAVIEQGITSSLHPQNLRSRRAVVNPELGAERPAFALLFDPQTAGGLLASVPEATVDAAIRELVAAGYPAACRLGTTTEGEPRITLGSPG